MPTRSTWKFRRHKFEATAGSRRNGEVSVQVFWHLWVCLDSPRSFCCLAREFWVSGYHPDLGVWSNPSISVSEKKGVIDVMQKDLTNILAKAYAPALIFGLIHIWSHRGSALGRYLDQWWVDIQIRNFKFLGIDISEGFCQIIPAQSSCLRLSSFQVSMFNVMDHLLNKLCRSKARCADHPAETQHETFTINSTIDANTQVPYPTATRPLVPSLLTALLLLLFIHVVILSDHDNYHYLKYYITILLYSIIVDLHGFVSNSQKIECFT